MIAFFFYLLKANICIGICYLFYKAFLQNLSFYQWNRFFLLATMVLSLVIPLVVMPDLLPNKNIPVAKGFFTSLQANVSNANKQAQLSVFNLSPVALLLIVYILGVSVHLAKLLLDLRKVVQLIRSHPASSDVPHIVETDIIPTCSFLNYIFINKDGLSATDLNQVIRHEQIHVEEKHTLDILFLCFIGAFFWFNPLVKIIRDKVEELHEFMVDERVVQYTTVPQYSRLLLRLATSDRSNVQVSSNFAHIQLKRRIVMLNQRQSDNIMKLRFLCIAPLVALVFGLFSFMQLQQSTYLLFGTWKGTKVTATGPIHPKLLNDGRAIHQSSVILLRTNKTCVFDSKIGGNTGTWELKDRQLTMKVGEEHTQYLVTEITKNKVVGKQQIPLGKGVPPVVLTYTFEKIKD